MAYIVALVCKATVDFAVKYYYIRVYSSAARQ